MRRFRGALLAFAFAFPFAAGFAFFEEFLGALQRVRFARAFPAFAAVPFFARVGDTFRFGFFAQALHARP